MSSELNKRAELALKLSQLESATDGRGLRVRLIRGEPNAKNLKRDTCIFANINDGFPPRFIGGFDNPTDNESTRLAEVAFYRNLALLAEASALALEIDGIALNNVPSDGAHDRVIDASQP